MASDDAYSSYRRAQDPAESSGLLPATKRSASDGEHEAPREPLWQCGSGADACVTAVVCVVYMLVGPLLILCNKYLLSRGGFPHPLLLTTLMQLSSSVVSFALVRVLKVVPQHYDFPWLFYVRNIAALGLASAVTLCLGNSSYLYLSMAFIEILKGFAPVVTMAVQTCFSYPWPRASHAGAVLAISIGTAIASAGELHLDLMGVAVMVGSIYFEAVRLILTQQLLGARALHVVEGLYYIAPASLLWVALAAAVIDLPRLDVCALAAQLPRTWPAFAMVALLGFAVNVSSFLVIQRTNVVMLKLL